MAEPDIRVDPEHKMFVNVNILLQIDIPDNDNYMRIGAVPMQYSGVNILQDGSQGDNVEITPSYQFDEKSVAHALRVVAKQIEDGIVP